MSVAEHAVGATTVALASGQQSISNSEASKDAPEKYEGFLMKKKKWPLKGYHRRYFLLENGFLKYAKHPRSVTKNKLRGLMDMGLSVMSTKKNALTIDLDAADTIFHLKVKSTSLYQLWVTKLRHHRDFRLHELNKDATLTHVHASSDAISSPILSSNGNEAEPSFDQEKNLETCSQSLKQAQHEVRLLEKMLSELREAGDAAVSAFLTMPPTSPYYLSKKDKERKSKKSSKKASKSVSVVSTNDIGVHFPVNATGSTPNFLGLDKFQVSDSLDSMQALSRSNPDISFISNPALKPTNLGDALTQRNAVQASRSVQSTPMHSQPRTATLSESSNSSAFSFTSLNDFTDKQRRFVASATNLQNSLCAIFDDLKHFDEVKQNLSKMTTMKNTIAQLNSENHDLRTRLQRIHTESTLTDPAIPSGGQHSMMVKRRLTSKTLLNRYLSESQLSVSESVSEMFYDAEEYLISDEESTTSEEESETGEDDVPSDVELSDGSETMSAKSMPYDVEEIEPTVFSPGRRVKLPCHRPNVDVSLWNILKKNIGKDLSKVAMPVTLNEPLNALQLLCEELEYSQLLDKADQCDDIYEQLVYVAAFAISGYGSTYTRAGQKPFNPILGETYEYISEDDSYRFVAEQVSHHPPISVCHCEGGHFEFWQAGTRWIEHYGDMLVQGGEGVQCKIVFSKSGYWSGKSGEVSGSIIDSDGKVRYKLSGKWYEAIQCTTSGDTPWVVWKCNPLPVDYDKQYGFTRFAITLNDLQSDLVQFLPRSDTRFRPDQRCLENGDISNAEKEKVRVEQLQREHKKQRDAQKIVYAPMFFQKVNEQSEDEGWIFKGNYWKLRKDPGFSNVATIPELW